MIILWNSFSGALQVKILSPICLYSYAIAILNCIYLGGSIYYIVKNISMVKFSLEECFLYSLLFVGPIFQTTSLIAFKEAGKLGRYLNEWQTFFVSMDFIVEFIVIITGTYVPGASGIKSKILN